MCVNLSLHFHDAFVPAAIRPPRRSLVLPSVASRSPAPRPHAVTGGSSAAVCRANRRSEVGETEARDLMWYTLSLDKMVLAALK